MHSCLVHVDIAPAALGLLVLLRVLTAFHRTTIDRRVVCRHLRMALLLSNAR